MSRHDEDEERTPKALLSKGEMTHEDGKRIQSMNIGIVYDDETGVITLTDKKAHQEYLDNLGDQYKKCSQCKLYVAGTHTQLRKRTTPCFLNKPQNKKCIACTEKERLRRNQKLRDEKIAKGLNPDGRAPRRTQAQMEADRESAPPPRQLPQEITDRLDKLTAVFGKVDELTQQVGKLTSLVWTLRRSNRDLTEQNEALTKKCNRLENRVIDKCDEMDAKCDEFDDKMEELDELKRNLQSQPKAQTDDQTIKAIKTLVKSHHKRLETIEEKADATAEQVDSLGIEMVRLSDDIVNHQPESPKWDSPHTAIECPAPEPESEPEPEPVAESTDYDDHADCDDDGEEETPDEDEDNLTYDTQTKKLREGLNEDKDKFVFSMSDWRKDQELEKRLMAEGKLKWNRPPLPTRW